MKFTVRWLSMVPPWFWVVVGLLFLNALTFDWYTTVWMDEAMFVDPAANLYYGHGFTSSAWATQHYGEPWVGNTPLYSLLLFTWFKMCGFGIFQARLLDYLLWSAAVALICCAVQRLNLVRRPLLVAALAALLFIGNGTTFSYRSGRYDPLIILMVAFCFFCCSLKNPLTRNIAITISALFLLPTALFVGVFMATFGLLLFLFFREKVFTRLCVLAAGMAVGLGLLYLAYSHFGLWHAFRKAAAFLAQIYYPPNATTPVWKQKLFDLPYKMVHDVATDILLLVLLGIAVIRWKVMNSTGRKLALFAVAVFVLLPCVSQFIYSYQNYHCWQVYIPLAICFVSIAAYCEVACGKLSPVVIVLTVFVVFIFGLGSRLGLASIDYKDWDYSAVESFVKENVRPSDIVYADYQASYPLHEVNAQSYYSWYFNVMTRREANSINCLVIRPGTLPFVQEKLGGQWEQIDASLLRENKFSINIFNRLLPNYFKQKSNEKYNLIIYRRVSANPSR